MCLCALMNGKREDVEGIDEREKQWKDRLQPFLPSLPHTEHIPSSLVNIFSCSFPFDFPCYTYEVDKSPVWAADYRYTSNTLPP